MVQCNNKLSKPHHSHLMCIAMYCRFTEIFVDELDDVNDLKTLVVNYLQGLSPTAAIVDGIVR